MVNKKFIYFMFRKWYLILLLLLLCATYGSIRGAYKEHQRSIWITSEDTSIRDQIDTGTISGKGLPKFIGYLGIANEQNEFYSFKLAAVCALLGIVPTFFVLLLYYKIYDTSLVKWFRKLIMGNHGDGDRIIRD